MRLRYTLSDRQSRCFANVSVVSLVVAKHCTDDARVVRDECIEGIDASHSRYADLINNVANGGAVLSVVSFFVQALQWLELFVKLWEGRWR